MSTLSLVVFFFKSLGYVNNSKGGWYTHTHTHTHTFLGNLSKLQLLVKNITNETL